jgi:SsrA-binding protein
MSEKKNQSRELASNKKGYHNYEILETFEAGIILTGTEIKSLRSHGASLQESYVKIISNEPWLIGAYIAPYTFGNIYNHDERRDRKLLMHHREIENLRSSVQEKGMSIIALSLYLKNGRVKVKVALGRGKNLHDKRATIKEKEEKRTIQRAIKEHN